MTRQHGLVIFLTQLGDGQLVLDTPANQLLPLDGIIPAPNTPHTGNLRLVGGYVRTRTGYKSHYARPGTISGGVNGLFLAQFRSGSIETLRGDQRYVYDNSAGSAWGAAAIVSLGGADALSDYWRFAMVRRAASPISNMVFMSNGDNARSMYAYGGGAVAATAVTSATFYGPRAIVGLKGRAIVGNMYESSTRMTTRLRWSIVGVGDLTTVDFATTGSGFADLDDDPYPIIHAAVISGNLCVFKSTQVGGSLIVGTLTGSSTTPYRFDTINTAGMSLLFPRTFVQIDPTVAFFVGHDGFYLYDGARGLLPVATNITRTLMPTLNYANLDAGFAYYKPKTFEITVGLPTGVSTYPTVYYVINMRDRRIYGPMTYDIPLYCATPYIATGSMTWNDLVGYTWETLPYDAWDSMGPNASTATTLFGDVNGDTWEDDDVTLTDNGTSVTGTYRSAVIVLAGRRIALTNGTERILQPDDRVTLRDVTLVYDDNGSWTPVVRVTRDGSTWTTLSTGVSVGGAGLNTRTVTYTAYDNTAVSGNWFQFEVSGGYNMRLTGIRAEFTYGGSGRAYDD